MSEPKRPRRPTPQDDNCLADFWAQYADRLEAELTQLRTERDEALQREAKNADKLKQ